MTTSRFVTARLVLMVLACVSLERGASAAPPLRVQVEKSKVDLKQHRLEMTMSRPGKVKITVVGESGATLADEEHDFSSRAAGAPLVVTWSPSSDEAVATIDVRATDASGAWVGVQISPWFVAIPHEDVNFATDKADIADAETPKLDAALAKLKEVLAKDAAHGRQHPGLTLFIAGHTDTVGNAAYNLKLSAARARSIAAWFRAHGVKLPVAFEGFGETAPAVKTADNVDEPRNRRVDYILSDDPPTYSGGLRASWKRIP
ncbi:MAG TPA: OmpA family protein [Polyangia bacterium]|nr:OmpA family protein [Polyangia bacterium]